MPSLPLLGAAVVVFFKSQGWREFGEAIVWVHLNAMILAAALVGRFESTLVSGAVKCEELIEAVSNPLETAAVSVQKTIGPAGFWSILIRFADNLFWHFHQAMKDVADSPAKLASRGVGGSGRCLNVCHHASGRDEKCCKGANETFHDQATMHEISQSRNGKIDFL